MNKEEISPEQIAHIDRVMRMITDNYIPCKEKGEADFMCSTIKLAEEMESNFIGSKPAIVKYLPEFLEDEGFCTTLLNDLNRPEVVWLFKEKQ